MREIRFPVTRTAIVVLIVAVGGLSLVGCSSSSKKSSSTTAAASATTKGSGGNNVQIKGFAFGPRSLAVKTGTKVTWTNNDSADHTVTADKSDPATFDSGHLGSGKSFAFTFTKSGTYKYVCSIHKSMTATVVVSS